MLSKINIGQRLYLCALLMMVAFAVIVVMFKNSLNSTNDTYQTLLDKEVEVSKKALRISELFKSSRVHERSFLAKRSNEELDAHKSKIAELLKECEEVNSLAAGHKKIILENKSVINAAQNYEKSFDAIAASWKTKGFTADEKDGLQKQFTDIADNLMQSVKKHQVEALFIAFNKVREKEKDYFYKNEPMYRTQLDMALVDYWFALTNADLSEGDTEIYKKSHDKYKDLVKNLSETKTPEARNAAYSALANHASKINSDIKSIYVPQIRSKILMVRNDELAYLLRGRESKKTLDELIQSHGISPEEMEFMKQSSNAGGGGAGLLDGLIGGAEEEKEEEIQIDRSEMDNSEKTIDSLKALKKSFTDLSDYLSDADTNDATAAIEKYEELFKKLVKEDDFIAFETEKLKAASQNFDKSVQNIVLAAGKATTETINILDENVSRSVQDAVMMSAFTALIALGLFYIVRSSIISPLKSTVEFADKLASKDLDAEINIDTRDEIGVLAKSLETARSNLNNSLRVISDKTVKLNTAVGVLTDETGKTTTSTEMLSENLSQVDENAELLMNNADKVLKNIIEVTTNIESVSAAVNLSKDNILSIAASTEEMSVTIAEISDNADHTRVITEKASDETDLAISKVGELVNAANEIKEVVKIIYRISEQTQILSLNATIEAAKAGEAGNGFAVVAKEVKDLSHQTDLALDKIQESIGKITTSTGETAEQMSQVNSVIKEICGASTSIANAIEGQSQTVRENSNNISDATIGLEEITNNMEGSAGLVSEVSKQVKEMNDSIIQVANQCSRSNNENAAILDSIRNMNSVVQQRDDSKEESDRTQSLEKMAGDLKDLVSEFNFK